MGKKRVEPVFADDCKGEKKTLIPCYKGIDAYDMPKEFAKLQAQDMGKVGAIQDLLRGIEKILGGGKKEVVKEAVVVQSADDGRLTALLKRGYMALEDREWKRADEFFEQALNMDAECAGAYLGKTLAMEHEAELNGWIKTRMDAWAPKTVRLIACPEDTAYINAAANEHVVPEYLGETEIQQMFTRFDRAYLSTVSEWQAILEKEQAYFSQDKLMSRAIRYAKGDLANRLTAARGRVISTAQKRLAEAKAVDKTAKERITTQYGAFLETTRGEAKARQLQAIQKRDADAAHEKAEAARREAEEKVREEEQRRQALLEQQGRVKIRKRHIATVFIIAVLVVVAYMAFKNYKRDQYA